jgi:hypothetical protein
MTASSKNAFIHFSGTMCLLMPALLKGLEHRPRKALPSQGRSTAGKTLMNYALVFMRFQEK